MLERFLKHIKHGLSWGNPDEWNPYLRAETLKKKHVFTNNNKNCVAGPHNDTHTHTHTHIIYYTELEMGIYCKQVQCHELPIPVAGSMELNVVQYDKIV